MKKFLARGALVATALLASTLALAQPAGHPPIPANAPQVGPAAKPATAAPAAPAKSMFVRTKPVALTGQEAEIAKKFAERAAGATVDSVTRTPFGLYEVVTDGQIFYVDPNVDFVFSGSVFDAKTRNNITAQRREDIQRVDVKALPLERAVKVVRGNGSRTLITFEDPNCPYCKKLWSTLQDVKDVTIYTFLMPILSDDSYAKSKAIWCAKDRGKVWDGYMSGGKAPPAAGADCKTDVLDANMEMGRALGITGTPTLVFADGRRVSSGGLTVAELEQRMGAAKK